MDAVAEALSHSATRDWYLAFCVALMILPMVALSIWFHRSITASSGGWGLMRRQFGTFSAADGVAMMRDVAAGRYGKHAKAMMTKVYWVVGLWVVVNLITFGILLWADEINRAPIY